MLALAKTRLDSKPERGQYAGFALTHYCEIEPVVSKTQALKEINAWAKLHGYRVTVNEVNYVSIIRDKIS